MVSPPLGLFLAGIFFANASWFAHQRTSSQSGAVAARKVKTTRCPLAGQVHFYFRATRTRNQSGSEEQCCRSCVRQSFRYENPTRDRSFWNCAFDRSPFHL